MTFIEILFIGVALSIDAYAVAISLALCSATMKRRFLIAISLLHFAMPIIGYILSDIARGYIADYVDYVVLLIFTTLGAKIIYEATYNREKREQECNDNIRKATLSLFGIYLLAFALSIDSITAGFSIGLQKTYNNYSNYDKLLEMLYPSLIFGLCALLLSIAGLMVGNHLKRFNPTATEIIGGVILILIGIKNIL